MAPVDGFDASPEYLRDEGAVAQGEGDDGPPDEIDAAELQRPDQARVDQRRDDKVDGLNQAWSADERNVVQDDEHGHAAYDLHPEGGELPHNPKRRHPAKPDQKARYNGEKERREGHPQGGEQARGGGQENDAIVGLAHDVPENHKAEQDCGKKPERELFQAIRDRDQAFAA